MATLIVAMKTMVEPKLYSINVGYIENSEDPDFDDASLNYFEVWLTSEQTRGIIATFQLISENEYESGNLIVILGMSEYKDGRWTPLDIGVNTSNYPEYI